MEEKQLSDYLAAFRRHRRAFAAIFAGLLVLCLGVALLLPSVYRSAATILIEEQEIPPELVRSTITSYAAQRLQTINQRVMTRSNLLGIIDKFDLYADRRKRETTEEIIERMRDDIAFQTISAEVIDPRSGHPTVATIAFSLSFDGHDPGLVQKVTNEITNLYLEENLKNRTQKTAEATDFLTSEVEQMGAVAAELEKKLSAFKEANIDALQEQKPLIAQSMERVEHEIKEIDLQIRALQERNFLVDSQLAQVSPESPVYSSGEHVNTPGERLKALRTAYITLSAKYSERHPDVVKMRQEIEALEKQAGAVDPSADQAKQLGELRTERMALAEKYAEGHPDLVALDKRIGALEDALARRPKKSRATLSLAESEADNPAFLNLLAQKESNALEIDGLSRRRTELRAKLVDYEHRQQRTPEVERQYMSLARDWENATVRYRELKAKLGEAQIGEQLERKSKGERFAIVEPPLLPEKPIKPNRPVIAVLGLALALAAAAGYVLLRETLDSSVRKVQHIAALTGAPPLAVIPHLDPDAGGPGRTRRRLMIGAALGVGLLIALLLVHWLWIPLDVLWFRGLRKIDALW
ncbi:GNVR domain-containing protein [Methylomagnum sp.]